MSRFLVKHVSSSHSHMAGLTYNPTQSASESIEHFFWDDLGYHRRQTAPFKEYFYMLLFLHV